MKRLSFTSLLMFILFLSACVPAPAGISTQTPLPPEQPTQTSTSFPVTPVESAFAPDHPTAAPLEEIIASHSVTFQTPDGATIKGELYGAGKTAVIFSVMGNCKPGWRNFAQLTAAQGIMALTYQWRDCGPGGPISDEQLIRNFVNDARGAIDFVREQGAENVILAGASLGGIASAKLAIESNASGLIVFASPAKIPNHDFKIEAADLNTDIPKLFLTAENDSVVAAHSSRELYEMAAEPREWQTYPGTAHGTDLFEAENGKEVQDRILDFILTISATL